MQIRRGAWTRLGLWLTSAAIIAAGVGAWTLATRHKAYTPAPLTNLGDAPRTQVVATLDAPIETGKNTVWCASFVAAWKRMQNDLSGGTIELDRAPELWQRLNNAVDPKQDVPAAALYAVAGRAADGITDTIRRDMAKRFPDAPPPNVPQLEPGDLLAYARLEVSARFPIPYFDDPSPLNWTDGFGKTMGIRAFGIPDHSGHASLRAQPRVLWASAETSEFILSLGGESEPIEIIVAQVQRLPTLAETLTRITDNCRQFGTPRELPHGARILIPEMAWRLEHSFAQLAGTRFTSGPLKDFYIRGARQDIDFRLDRSGAELKSEASMAAAAAAPEMSFIITGPFLLIMRQRSAERPFFVAWIENDELLRRFDDADIRR